MLTDRQRLLVLVSLLYDAEKSLSLFSLFPKEREALTEMANDWLARTPELRRTELLRKLKKHQHSPVRLQPQFIHPEWFIDVLKREGPRLATVILRLFPREFRETLVTSLKSHGLVVLDKAAPAIDPELMQLVEERFARIWELSPECRNSPLAVLAERSHDELARLMRSVARGELALALHGLKKSAYTAIFHRLPLDDAKAISDRMRSFDALKRPLDKKAQQKARMHVLSLDIDKLQADELSLYLGFYLFSKAILEGRDEELGRHVAWRFPVAAGRKLLALMAHHRQLNTARSAAPYQKRFLETTESLVAGKT